MKNVFLIGNGFDLYHKLPTTYFDFMCVAECFIARPLSSTLSIGEIFSKCDKSKNIQMFYGKNKEYFDNTTINMEKMSQLTNITSSNIWFHYFLKTFDADLGWIDFEKEISMVIKTLNKLIPNDSKEIRVNRSDTLSAFILSNFSFFLSEAEVLVDSGNTYEIHSDYLRQYPFNSNIYVADKKEIFETLYGELYSFSQALQIYFECFIEKSFEFLYKAGYVNEFNMKIFEKADDIIIFNYTRTIEELYQISKNIYHIHGTVKAGEIVLGVNPGNENENLLNDINLIKFKKYYQREIYNSDVEYIKWYREIVKDEREYRIITIGHSLDKTDSDILSELFKKAKEIYISYHNDKAKTEYMSNITQMFGEQEFTKFKIEKNLKFVSLSDINNLNKEFNEPEITWDFIQ